MSLDVTTFSAAQPAHYSTISHLTCSQCGREYSRNQVYNLCSCGGPLFVCYDLEQARERWTRGDLASSPKTMWRYSPVLPVQDQTNIISLGEGMTPLIRARSIGNAIGASDLWVKDEGMNPTGSFKARGLSCAVSMAKELGLSKLAIPSAGNAASAMAAYAAAAHMEAHIFLPKDAPRSNVVEARTFGATVVLVDGLINDCAAIVGARKSAEGWFEVTTLKEPYRIEGKKTMAYEIAEQLDWRLPDAIVYPAGGGVGLIGMWKAFDEMEKLGWISGKRPKMIAVQAIGCHPIVRAFQLGAKETTPWKDARTVAGGFRVPKPLGDVLMLNAIRESGGTAIAIDDQQMFDSGLLLAREEGIFSAPEGGACVAAVQQLLEANFLQARERIVVFITASGLKYIDSYSEVLASNGDRFPKWS